MTGTVKDHLDQADQIQAHVKEADALVRKLKEELIRHRHTFEWLKDFCPPDWVRRKVPLGRARDPFGDQEVSMSEMLDARIAAINAVLGDRA